MRKTFANPSHIINSNDVHQLEDQSIVVSLAMPNLLQDYEQTQKDKDDAKENEVPAASCEFLEVSIDHAPTISENETKGNKNGATLAQGKNSFDELTLSTNHAIIEQHLVKPLINLPLLQEYFQAVSCDKEELCVDNSISHVPQLVDNCNIFSLEPYICGENKFFLPIISAQDELKLLSSLNTLGYIEFDVLCNLSCLEDKLFANSELSWLSHNTYHFIGKYNFREEYMVH